MQKVLHVFFMLNEMSTGFLYDNTAQTSPPFALYLATASVPTCRILFTVEVLNILGTKVIR